MVNEISVRDETKSFSDINVNDGFFRKSPLTQRSSAGQLCQFSPLNWISCAQKQTFLWAGRVRQLKI